MYKQTIAIANIHLQTNDFAGIFYPTIRLNGEEDNYAIKKTVIDNNSLIHETSEYIEIIDVIDNRYRYKIIDVATEIYDGNIIWRELNKHWMRFDDSEDIFFMEENEQINAYNQHGDLVKED